MKKIKEKNLYWIILSATIILILTIAAYTIIQFLPTSAGNTVRITKVRKGTEFANAWADAYIEGKWQEIHYYNLRFHITIKNSRTIDVSDLKLVINLTLGNRIISSRTRMIGTLKAGKSRTVEAILRGIPHIYLFDDSGNLGDMIDVITLYSQNKLLDQKTIT